MATFRPHAWASQEGFSFRFDWGANGLHAISPGCGAIIIVDVLRFSTAASMITELGGQVELTDDPNSAAPSLEHLARTVLDRPGVPVPIWSQNGGALAHEAIGSIDNTDAAVFVGCFRNAEATASAALEVAEGRPIAVVAAGEWWDPSSFRPATEDLLGAGAVLASIDPGGSLTEPCCSPAARAARAAFRDAEPLLLDLLTATASGRELWERGEGDDVRSAARLNIAAAACRLDR